MTYFVDQPFFTEADIAKALLTPEEERTVRGGCCPKCNGALGAASRAPDMQFRQCPGCQTTYCLPAEL